MKAENLTVEVNAKVTVSDETAERCLRLLEMWQEDNPDKTIRGETRYTENGVSAKYEIVRRGE